MAAEQETRPRQLQRKGNTMSATPPESNATAPQTPKTGVWKWIAIGCLGIFLLTFGGCALMWMFGAATLTVNGKRVGGEKANPESAIGLWRYESEVSKGLMHLKSDGTIKTLGYKTEGGIINELTGKYTLSGGNLMITDIIYDGAPLEKATLAPIPFEASGDTALIDGEVYTRVPEKDVVAVLANPFAP